MFKNGCLKIVAYGLWLLMVAYGCLWLLMIYGCLWLLMVAYGYGCLFYFKVAYGCLFYVKEWIINNKTIKLCLNYIMLAWHFTLQNKEVNNGNE